MFASLYQSEILEFLPTGDTTNVYWLQRICMVPLVFILGKAVLDDYRPVIRYCVPLVAMGICSSVIYLYRSPQENAAFLGLTSFLLILFCLFLSLRRGGEGA